MSLPKDFVSSLYLAPYTKPVFGSIYLEKAGRDNNEIMHINS